ncbi:MAG: hypothetical protein KDA94_03850, partial [Acidimicrobiales bacterium]|nr:hypothetical protein [Acidimicrobiales bacterium]
WGVAWSALWFVALGMARQRHRFEVLDRLRFIYAIRWTVLPPFERRRPGQRWGREHRWQLLFESNFDGDWDEYLDAFGSVVPDQLHRILAACDGYPGLAPITLFKDWAKASDHLPEAYATAYPDITPVGIRQAIARTGPRGRARIVAEGFGRTRPNWSTFLIPLAPGAASRASAAARDLDGPAAGQEPFLLRGQDSVHFARLAIVPQATRTWLLLTITHEGPVEPVIERLVREDADATGPDDLGPLRRLLACTDAMPTSGGGWSDAEVVAYVLAHRPKGAWMTLRYCAYPGWTPRAIRALQDADAGDAWPIPDGAT